MTIEATISDERAWNLIHSRSLSGVSIGFLAHGVRAGAGDNPDEIYDWELAEVSLTPVPANREAMIESVRALPEKPSMTTEITPLPRLVSSTPASPYIRRKIEPFSISRAVADLVNGRQLSGIEAEISGELEKRSDTPTRGLRVPASLFQQRTLDTSPGSAGSLSQPTDYIASLLDDVAASRRWGTLTPRLGCTVISSIRENVSIPKRTAVLSGSWGPKDANAPDAGDMIFAKDDLTPLYAKATTAIERSALKYSNPAVDQIVITDLASALHSTIDAGVIYGSGVGDVPRGLLMDPGTTIPLAGRLATSTDLFAVKQAIMTAWKMDDEQGLRWLLSQASYDAFRTTSVKRLAEDAGEEWMRGIAPFESGEGVILGIMAVQSGRVPVTVAGPPAQYNIDLLYPEMMVVVYFGGASVDMIVDPYSLSVRGAVRMTAFVDVNCVNRDNTSHFRLSGVNSVVPQGALPLAAPPAPPPAEPEQPSEPQPSEPQPSEPEPPRRPGARPEGYGRR